jgi:hypothetical protein
VRAVDSARPVSKTPFRNLRTQARLPGRRPMRLRTTLAMRSHLLPISSRSFDAQLRPDPIHLRVTNRHVRRARWRHTQQSAQLLRASGTRTVWPLCGPRCSISAAPVVVTSGRAPACCHSSPSGTVANAALAGISSRRRASLAPADSYRISADTLIQYAPLCGRGLVLLDDWSLDHWATAAHQLGGRR